MNRFEKIIFGIAGIILLPIIAITLYANRPVTQPSYGSVGALYRNQFNTVNIATTTSVGVTPVLVVPSSSVNYVSIDNSGTVGVSCFPVDLNGVQNETTTGLTYGGGWWLAPSGGVISLDSVALYGGTIYCFTTSGTTTLGIVAR